MQQIKDLLGRIAEKLIVAGLNKITCDGYDVVFKHRSLKEVMDIIDNYYTAVGESKKYVEIEKLKVANIDLTPRYDEENDPVIYEEQDMYLDLCAALQKVIQKGEKNDKRSLKVGTKDKISHSQMRSLDFDNGIGVVDFYKGDEEYSASFYFPPVSINPSIKKMVDMILKLKADQYVVNEKDARKAIREFCNSITKIKRVKDLHVKIQNEKGEEVSQATHVLKASTRNSKENKNVYLIQTIVNPESENAEIFQYQISSELPLSQNENHYCEIISYALSQYYQGKENNLLNSNNVESYSSVDLEILYTKNREMKERNERKQKVVDVLLNKGNKNPEQQKEVVETLKNNTLVHLGDNEQEI